MKDRVVVFWFRRDLRLDDNTGLNQALAQGLPVLPLFIYEEVASGEQTPKYDRSVDYRHQALKVLNNNLKAFGSRLQVYAGAEIDVFKSILDLYEVEAVFINREYEPVLIQQLEEVKSQLKTIGISLYDFKDQVIFEYNEVLKKDGTPYTVYGPYAKKWKERLQERTVQYAPAVRSNFYQTSWLDLPKLRDFGYENTDVEYESWTLNEQQIRQYELTRNFPSIQGTSKVGAALRFGTVSIRYCVWHAQAWSEVWLNELIWREFFKQILFHFPFVENKPFKRQFETFPWRNNEEEFVSWCLGRTGVPMVDAGMRELNETGFMHNRVRMIVASFLCKHLLIDWRWGEAYFAEKLLDYDLSANNGNWQWVAGTGCDAAPFFRIFNPILQAKKFDADSMYQRRWIPELDDQTIKPIVDLQQANKRALSVYQLFRESY